MARIRAQKIRNELPLQSKRKLYGIVAYFYPQYKLEDVQAMPHRDVKLLIETAQKQEAIKMLNLANVVYAPNAKDKKACNKLLDYFRKLAKD